MARYRQRIKVPANRVIRINIQLDKPENARVTLIDEEIEIDDFAIAGMTVTINIPESVTIGSKVVLEVTDEGPWSPVFRETTSKAMVATNNKSVLSLSITDVTALRVLPILANDERRHDIYTGAGFGLFLSVLLATGAAAHQLRTAFLNWGFPSDNIRLIDRRFRFDPILNFCRNIFPGFDGMTVGGIKNEIFIPVVNGRTGDPEIISKETTPDFPLSSAIKCSLANLLDYRPLMISGSGDESKTAFSSSGVVWSYSAFGSCPDGSLLNYYGDGLKFTTFVSPPLISERSTKDLKNHKELASHYQVDEVGKRLKTGETVDLLSRFVSGYKPIVLESLPTMNYLQKNQIDILLGAA